MLLKKIIIAAAVASSFMGAAQAAPITATGAVSLVGIGYSPTGSIGLGTTFTYQFSLISSTTGDLSIVPVGSLLTTQSMTATAGSAVNFAAAWGSFTGTVSSAMSSGPATGRVVNITADGTFTPLSGPPDLSAFDPGPMQLTFSATQTGVGASISASYTISSMAPQAVPEPGSLALAGLALLAAGGLTRRKLAA